MATMPATINKTLSMMDHFKGLLVKPGIAFEAALIISPLGISRVVSQDHPGPGADAFDGPGRPARQVRINVAESD
jgi:hypothetical protein